MRDASDFRSGNFNAGDISLLYLAWMIHEDRREEH